MDTLGRLRRISIDWSDFEEAGRITRDIAQELSADRPLLRRMALAVGRNEALLSLSEKHGELNYIVLRDFVDQGIRVRLHRFSKGQEDIPHNHRFSFSSAILHGSYVHTLFELDWGNAEVAEDDLWRLSQPPGTHRGVALQELSLAGFTPLLTTTQTAGSAYSLHHTTIHKTAMPKEDAFSVFVRGPAQKPCALQLEPDYKSYRWKFGRQHEEDRVLSDRRMSPADYLQFIESLEDAGVI